MNHANDDVSARYMLTGKAKWLGLALMGVAVLATITSGALAFNGMISVDDTISIIRWCVLLLGVPGFVLHMIVVRQQWKEKHRSDKI